MPHCILEHTANVSIDRPSSELLLQINQLLNAVAGISLDNCKSRHRICEQYCVGDGEKLNAFVHLDVRFIEGRSQALKQQLGGELKALLKQAFASAKENLRLQITVEVRDILIVDYHKYPEGTLTSQK